MVVHQNFLFLARFDLVTPIKTLEAEYIIDLFNTKSLLKIKALEERRSNGWWRRSFYTYRVFWTAIHGSLCRCIICYRRWHLRPDLDERHQILIGQGRAHTYQSYADQDRNTSSRGHDCFRLHSTELFLLKLHGALSRVLCRVDQIDMSLNYLDERRNGT